MQYLPVKGRVIELGNQTILFDKHYGKAAKVVLEECYDHVSIDINGRDGALPYDLNQRIELPPADVVTDFGTGEHVDDFYQLWKN